MNASRPEGASVLSRRRLLAGGLAGAGAVAAGAAGLALAAADGEDGPAYACWRQQDKGELGDLEYLVLCATLAPSPHNTQPWRFRLEDRRILVHADLSRHLGAADAQFRMMQVGLGCAIENLEVAAARLGYRCRIDTGEADARFAVDGRCARIELTRAGVERRPAFEAMFRRQTTRAAFDPHADLPADLRGRLVQCAEGLPGVRLHWLRATAAEDRVGDVVRQAARDYLSDERHRAGMKWFRIKRAEWERRRDGIAVFNTDAPALAKQYVEHFVAPSDVLGPSFRDSEIASVDRLSAATSLWGLVVADGSGPGQRLAAGRLAERIYLQATVLGLAVQPMCYPTETPAGAAALRRLADVPDGHEPVFLFRLGRSGLVARSVRRPLGEVIV
jgi:nitroreductase